MRKRKSVSSIVLLIISVLLIGCTVVLEAPTEDVHLQVDDGTTTTSDVMFTWDSESVGESTLVRSDDLVHAAYETDGMTPGNAVTGWYIIFNKPELCEPSPFDCDPTDMFHPDYPGEQGPAEGDFLLLSGHVIDEAGKGMFEGSLAIGDASTSGLAEVICPETLDCTAGLTNAEGALIVLAAHDHGPALEGNELEAQLNTFLGGCVGNFNGDDFGFAVVAEDLPDAVGECSTIQVSPHMPSDG